ncbi:22495_t:CDS:2 [Gigaspora rosea]|nr:22495_t:CDS:2 [Gigaspora rosea]
MQGSNIENAENWEIINKKVRYANGFGKMKKALNVALDLGYDDELINIINQFINRKRSIIANNSKPVTKRLKSSSECQNYKALIHSYYTINSQDSNLRIPLAPLVNNDSNDGHALNNNIEKPCNKSKRRYLCNVCSGVGHNACMYKQQK